MTSIEWLGSSVRFLDQTELPLKELYIETSELEVLNDAIIKLKVRGAPLLGICAAYGILLGIQSAKKSSLGTMQERFETAAGSIAATRPTAKNLFWALERMRKILRLNLHESTESLFEKLEREALAIHEEDRQMCESIGRFGSELVPNGAKILTHCNTGALATGGIGTAFAVLLTAHRNGKEISVYADETRPLLQGSRLTMWELMNAGIPATLITDNSAAWTMKTKKIDLIITGADRITANGDSANKIGTYNLALLAKAHSIPFYIAAPTSTIDPSILQGEDIPIEERGAEEIVNGFGRQVAPNDARVFAPAFDVTPNGLITAIITEKGILRPPYNDSIREAVDR
ncbi:MAG: S-methyl-5-thioribose-1-phosphate isomerase [Bacteroidetes bacterium]|nr:S-methyl-5-thioribose-1-phosphate isomerase [Bacteroidota bacterium]